MSWKVFLPLLFIYFITVFSYCNFYYRLIYIELPIQQASIRVLLVSSMKNCPGAWFPSWQRAHAFLGWLLRFYSLLSVKCFMINSHLLFTYIKSIGFRFSVSVFKTYSDKRYSLGWMHFLLICKYHLIFSVFFLHPLE